MASVAEAQNQRAQCLDLHINRRALEFYSNLDEAVRNDCEQVFGQLQNQFAGLDRFSELDLNCETDFSKAKLKMHKIS